MADKFPYPPDPATPQALTPDVRLVLCPNASPMTFHGTNTYIVGQTELAVIDPGPDHDGHLDAILAAVRPGQKITHIIVTHSHVDHSPLAAQLSKHCGAPIYAFGDATAGRSTVMQQLAKSGLAGGGEGIDAGFHPDHCLQDGETLQANGWQLKVLHTPGHLGNHICLQMGDICFSGDLVMGWASSIVSPPDGDLSDFMASCRRLARKRWSVFYPGHGAPVTEPAARLKWLIDHRLGREAEILAELEKSPATAQALTRAIYHDIPDQLLPVAERNVFAHLVDLLQRNRVRCAGPLGISAVFDLE